MCYADITRNDRNPIKRFFQRRRLSDALALAGMSASPRNIIDFGAGDGEFCRLLANRFPDARIYCYEPVSWHRQEAAVRLKDNPSVEIVDSVEALPLGQADLVFCMEVVEHLPARQTAETLAAIHGALAKDGTALIGVPVEIYAPAMFKGMFRMMRRFGEFDARPKNIFRAALGFPTPERPIAEISEGMPYHAYHLGFDFRKLREQLQENFHVLRTVCSPAKWFPAWMNSEIYFILRKAASNYPKPRHVIRRVDAGANRTMKILS
jgi:SAM-dependent methyltransferase